MHHHIKVNNALTQLKRKIPYGWDLNIYRGCGHGCQYCYAMYSHGYIGSEDFFTDIYAKINIVEELEKTLRSDSWKGDIINIGGVTDSYQPAEKEFQLMPGILELMIKYRNPCIISTKSTLVLRDYDLIEELSNLTYINVAATVTTMDEEVRKKLEPGSCVSTERFDMLKKFRKTNASIGVHLMPIVPYVTDSEINLDEIFRLAKDCGADYLLPGTLYLRGKTREHFFDFINREFPELYEEYGKLYRTGGADKKYKEKLYGTVKNIREKYGVPSSYMKPMREKLKV